jgi:hypothetical protein
MSTNGFKLHEKTVGGSTRAVIVRDLEPDPATMTQGAVAEIKDKGWNSGLSGRGSQDVSAAGPRIVS